MKTLHFILITLFLFIGTHHTFAQIFTNDFGFVSNVDFSFDEYEKDNEADALVIYDKGKSTFFYDINNFNISFERSTRIKILKESGKKYSEIMIPFYRDDNIIENIVNIKAYTYNMVDGQIERTQLDIEQVYEEKYSKFTFVKKFAMPNVKAGSVIEYSYELITPYQFHLPDWEFQREIPTVYSEYTVQMIPFYQYQWRLQGADSFDKHQTYEDMVQKYADSYNYNDMVSLFVMKDIPAFKDESFITSKNDYIIKLDFQLAKIIPTTGRSIDVITTWEKLVDDLLKEDRFGKYLKESSGKFKSLVKDENPGSMKEKERFDFIMNHIKYNYNLKGFNSKYSNQTVKEFLNEKHGNSAAKNLFLCGALNAFDIEAYPVILSTRDHGKIVVDYPFEQAFNYVIVYAKVNEKWGLYDVTDSFCPNDQIPVTCINEIGLLVKKGDVSWVKISPKNISIIEEKYLISLKQDNEVLNLRKNY
jgi:hypothetical protein